MERINLGGTTLFFMDKSSYEFLAGQFQKFTDKIFCVKNGCELRVFKHSSEIPDRLKRSYTKYDEITNITRYNYRSLVDDSLYTFFDHRVDTWLTCSRRGELKLSVIDTIPLQRQIESDQEDKTKQLDHSAQDINPHMSVESLAGKTIKFTIHSSSEIICTKVTITN